MSGPGANELQRFILRGQVIGLYRNCWRALRQAPDATTRAELQREVRREFEQHKYATEFYTIKYLISDGRTRLKQLHEIFGLRS